jgi:hypothetical protein
MPIHTMTKTSASTRLNTFSSGSASPSGTVVPIPTGSSQTPVSTNRADLFEIPRDSERTPGLSLQQLTGESTGGVTLHGGYFHNAGATAPANAPQARVSYEGNASFFSAEGTRGQKNGRRYAEGSVQLGSAEYKASGNVYADRGPLNVGLSGSAEVHLRAASAKGSLISNNALGRTTLSGNAEVVAEANGRGGVSVAPHPSHAVAYINGEAFAGARASIEAKHEVGSYRGLISAEGSAGAQAFGTAAVVFDPRHGSLGAGIIAGGFAGVQANARTEHTLGPVTVSAEVGVRAGVGGSFGVGAGIDAGHFKATADLGAALGLGVGAKVGVEVDMKHLAKDVRAVGHAVKDGAREVGHGAKEVGRHIKRDVKKVGHAVADGAREVGHSTKEVGRHIKHEIRDVFDR